MEALREMNEMMKKAALTKQKLNELGSVLDDDIFAVYEEHDRQAPLLLQLQMIRLLRQLLDKK